jgi:hypothetical protein
MKVDINFYVKKLKEHEYSMISTNERNLFWKNYNKK